MAKVKKGGFPKLGVPLGDPNNKNNRIFFGVYFGGLPMQGSYRMSPEQERTRPRTL